MRYSVKRKWYNGKSKRLRARSASGLLKNTGKFAKQILTTPAKSHTDKKIKYIRYADDFLIAVNGRQEEDCVEIKRKLAEFIGGMLKMELSEEKDAHYPQQRICPIPGI